MENKLNVPKLEYKTGEPMWVHWDNRYVLRGGHILQLYNKIDTSQ